MHSEALYHAPSDCDWCAGFRTASAPPVSWLPEGAERRRTACWPRLSRSTTGRELGPCLRLGRYGGFEVIYAEPSLIALTQSLSRTDVHSALPHTPNDGDEIGEEVLLSALFGPLESPLLC